MTMVAKREGERRRRGRHVGGCKNGRKEGRTAVRGKE
jgi:hypothetical protein